MFAPGSEGLLLYLGGQSHAVRHLGRLLLLLSLHHHPGFHGNSPNGTCGGRGGQEGGREDAEVCRRQCHSESVEVRHLKHCVALTRNIATLCL